jgi:hypothetical protein
MPGQWSRRLREDDTDRQAVIDPIGWCAVVPSYLERALWRDAIG